MWSEATRDRRVAVEFDDFEVWMPSGAVEAKVGEFAEFLFTSTDVT